MLSVIITALLLVVMLLIVASLLISAQREYRRHKQIAAARVSLPAHPLDRHVTAIWHLHEGNVVAVEEPISPFSLPPSWYIRRRTLVSMGFLVMLLLTLFVHSGLAEGPIENLSQSLSMTLRTYLQSGDMQVTVQPGNGLPTSPLTASMRVVRIDSAARSQYSNDYQWQVWSYSSCSAMAMEMVMNAYGRHLIAGEILQKELNMGVWSADLGLLREEGIAMTAALYGFTTDAGHTRTVADVVRTANAGAPVIVSIRDSYYYPNGHIFVVRGGDNQYVYIADSSTANFQRMTYAMFTGMWQGFSAVLKPNA